MRILALVIVMNFIQSLILISIGGTIYVCMELAFRGRSHISMFFCGGLCFWLIGLFNEGSVIFPLSIQAILGAAVITTSELLFGLVVNRWLHLGVWDYSAVPGNFLGQICLPFCAYWVLLSPLAALTDDAIRYIFFHEPWPPLVLF